MTALKKLQTGEITSPAEFQTLLQEKANERLGQEKARMQRTIEEEERQIAMWIQAGGRL